MRNSRTGWLIGVVLAAGLTTSVISPAEAASSDTISADRATVREYPGRLVLANAAKGDRAEVTAQCGQWVRIRVTTAHAMATPVGWVLRGNLTRAAKAGGLDGVPERCGTDADRWRDWVGAINAPFHSLRKTTVDGKTGWRRITFGTGVSLAAGADCTPSLNYTRRDGAPDVVDPAQRVAGLDLDRVAYRYVTQDGSVALISAPRPGGTYGVWGFVPATCLRPKGRATVYFDEPVVQVTSLSGLDTGVGYPDGSVRSRGCSAAVKSPSNPAFGYWPDPEPAHRPACPV
ncbi:hypothetical protein V5P93_007246 [Actinokineospora auranticolor]|uniref:SH3 domain-containing protein n=1 Tax=Actinokineospora auranticolor TaxID=155976 RepID=A0A2S6GRN9_9PSEU|nr:hypothetical protein [Actinokineospora auranticolor]PPK67902.1 hypothetical protein CLV40_106133 [Actinokineospora auranticolor]